jgi:hypothetical protein
MNPNSTSPVRATQHDWEVLRQSQPTDYDGHTHFDRMLPAQRLAWLESAVQFVADVNSKFYPHRLDSKKPERNKTHG